MTFSLSARKRTNKYLENPVFPVKKIKDSETGIQGRRDAIRMAFQRELIDNGDIWMKMIKSRALTLHTYNEDTALEIASDISGYYYNEFLKLQKKFSSLKEKEQNDQ